MAEKASQLVLRALATAAAEATDLPLHSSRGLMGLFPATAAGKQAALRCCEEGYLSPTADPPSPDLIRVRLTDRGLAHLLSQLSPRQVLEDFVRALESREVQLAQLLNSARQMQSSLQTLRGYVESTLARLGNPTADLRTLARQFHEHPAEDTDNRILAILRGRTAPVGADCPLPELYQQLLVHCPELSVGTFHDALRRLEQGGQLYLHPWTGPLPEMPQPRLALLAGHGIAYYASLRADAAARQVG